VYVLRGLDDLRKTVGQHLGYSDWVEVTQDQVDAFADATGDHQWIHVNPERAAKGPFAGTIAHGFLTLSLIPRLTAQIYRVEGITHGLNYGLNKVRFPSVVPTGSSLRAGAEVVSAVEVPGGLQSTVKVVIEREGGDKPVCVAETVTVLLA
jgi:acyl dehydratase